MRQLLNSVVLCDELVLHGNFISKSTGNRMQGVQLTTIYVGKNLVANQQAPEWAPRHTMPVLVFLSPTTSWTISLTKS